MTKIIGRRLLLPLASVLALFCAAAPVAAKAPNILFILTDDLDSVAAQTMEQANALIGAAGTSFKRHYVGVSLCCPSRVSTLRGQFAHNSGIIINDPPDGGFQGTYIKGIESSTVATWLQAAGYRTMLVGKYLNGYPDSAPSPNYIPPGWTEWYSPNGGYPYQEFNYTLNENGTTVPYGEAPADYLTDVIAAKANDFIRRSVQQHPDEPFFAYIATYAPHLPAIPAPRHADAFRGIKAPRSEAFNEADMSDKPSWLRDTPLLTKSEVADIDDQYRKRRQSLLAVDEMVKGLIDTLQATGQLDSTYVFFASDNGLHLGQHRLVSGKKSAYEEDILVPLMVRGPGVPVGRVVDALTANVDFAPTFAEIAAAVMPGFVDGRSLQPFLRGKTPSKWRQAVLLAHKEPRLPTPTSSGLLEPPDPFDKGDLIIGDFGGLRTADGRTYVEYAAGDFELYSNEADPQQLANRYAEASSKTKASLAAWVAALSHASGESLRQAELAPPPAR